MDSGKSYFWFQIMVFGAGIIDWFLVGAEQTDLYTQRSTLLKWDQNYTYASESKAITQNKLCFDACMLIFFSRTYSSEQWPHSHDGVWDYPGWKHVHCWHWVCHQLCILAKLAGLVKGKVVLKKSNVLFQYYIHIYIYISGDMCQQS